MLTAAVLVAGTAGGATSASSGAAAAARHAGGAADELFQVLTETGNGRDNETSCSISCILSSCGITCGANESAICRCDVVTLVALGGDSNGLGTAKCECVNATKEES